MVQNHVHLEPSRIRIIEFVWRLRFVAASASGPICLLSLEQFSTPIVRRLHQARSPWFFSEPPDQRHHTHTHPLPHVAPRLHDCTRAPRCVRPSTNTYPLRKQHQLLRFELPLGHAIHCSISSLCSTKYTVVREMKPRVEIRQKKSWLCCPLVHPYSNAPRFTLLNAGSNTHAHSLDAAHDRAVRIQLRKVRTPRPSRHARSNLLP